MPANYSCNHNLNSTRPPRPEQQQKSHPEIYSSLHNYQAFDFPALSLLKKTFAQFYLVFYLTTPPEYTFSFTTLPSLRAGAKITRRKGHYAQPSFLHLIKSLAPTILSFSFFFIRSSVNFLLIHFIRWFTLQKHHDPVHIVNYPESVLISMILWIPTLFQPNFFLLFPNTTNYDWISSSLSSRFLFLPPRWIFTAFNRWPIWEHLLLQFVCGDEEGEEKEESSDSGGG